MRLRHTIVGLIPAGLRIRKRAFAAWKNGEREIRLLPLLCDRHATSIDVGANAGIYSYFLSRYSDGIIALEPLPEFAQFVRSALPRARVIEAAASDHAGSAVLRVPLDPARDGMGTIELGNPLGVNGIRSIEVRLLTLDSLDTTRVGFVKIDVEGHEVAVLRGGLRMIDRDRPAILVEAEERHRKGAVDSIRVLLHEHGYHGFFLLNGEVRSIDQFDCALYQDEQLLRSDYQGPGIHYVNNFIFIHSQGRVRLTSGQLVAGH